MELDPVFLSRLQFAFLISFHIVFPAFTIGLAAWLATIEAARLATGKAIYRRVLIFCFRVSLFPLGWGWLQALSLAFSSAPTGAWWARRPAPFQGHFLASKTF